MTMVNYFIIIIFFMYKNNIFTVYNNNNNNKNITRLIHDGLTMKCDRSATAVVILHHHTRHVCFLFIIFFSENSS